MKEGLARTSKTAGTDFRHVAREEHLSLHQMRMSGHRIDSRYKHEKLHKVREGLLHSRLNVFR